MIFTTSWDDDTIFDMKMFDLLNNYGLEGTFYICKNPQHDYNLLNNSEIREIHNTHEVGAHTINHPHLPNLDGNQIKNEVIYSKDWIENITGDPCISFCPPYGDYNQKIIDIINMAGFQSSSTTNILQFNNNSVFEINPTFHVYPYPFRKKWGISNTFLIHYSR